MAAIFGIAFNTDQRYYNYCRGFNHPRSCHQAGCYWNWRFRQCISWWNYENYSNNDRRGERDERDGRGERDRRGERDGRGE